MTTFPEWAEAHTSDHLWCAAHGWHDAGQCPDR